MSEVPKEVVFRINELLKPYGEVYVPGLKPKDVKKATRYPDGYFSTTEACQYLGCSRSYLYKKLIYPGIVHPVKLDSFANGKIALPVAEIRAWLIRRQAEGRPTTKTV